MSPSIASKPRVFSLEPLHSEALALARERFDLVLPGEHGFERWRQEAEGLMARNAVVTREDVAVLAKCRLRYISKQGVGVDNFDLDALKAAGIPLMNTPGVNARAVAELALGLILDVARQCTAIDRKIRAGVAVTKKDGWAGQTLEGKTMGIVGGGNIGFLVAKMFHAAFDGPIILYDPFIDDEALRKWQGAIRGDGAFRLVDALDRLLEQADIISLHVPLTKSTENLIADREIRLMKRSAILVNTARGGIIHEGDLAIALAENRIFGAGLDAFVNEPPSLEAYPELCREDRVVMTPHIGAATEAAQQDTCRSMVEHLIEAFEGKTLRDRVC